MTQYANHPLSALRTRRQMCDVKPAELAKLIGISTTSYLRHERGERRIYLDRARTIARHLGCTIDQLALEPTADEQVAALRSRLTREIAEIEGPPTLPINQTAGGCVVAQAAPEQDDYPEDDE